MDAGIWRADRPVLTVKSLRKWRAGASGAAQLYRAAPSVGAGPCGIVRVVGQGLDAGIAALSEAGSQVRPAGEIGQGVRDARRNIGPDSWCSGADQTCSGWPDRVAHDGTFRHTTGDGARICPGAGPGFPAAGRSAGTGAGISVRRGRAGDARPLPKSTEVQPFDLAAIYGPIWKRRPRDAYGRDYAGLMVLRTGQPEIRASGGLIGARLGQDGIKLGRVGIGAQFGANTRITHRSATPGQAPSDVQPRNSLGANRPKTRSTG